MDRRHPSEAVHHPGPVQHAEPVPHPEANKPGQAVTNGNTVKAAVAPTDHHPEPVQHTESSQHPDSVLQPDSDPPGQVVLNGNTAAVAAPPVAGPFAADLADDDTSAPSIDLKGFKFGAIDDKVPKPRHPTAQLSEVAPTAVPPAPAVPDLGIALASFKGNWQGLGFNTIFRPSDGSTTFPNPPQGPNDNVLELNLTKEKLAFSSPIGNIPNRGSAPQKDVFLNGVPYVQTVQDVTFGSPVDIHFEPGIWLHVPATQTSPISPETLVRMASIPHGTTINAQCLAPTSSSPGPPIILPVDITPFGIGNPKSPFTGTFLSQDASNNSTPRIPQDLSKFIAAGTITQEILKDPNTVLRNAIKGLTITNTITFEVSTAPVAPIQGGGIANINFLGSFNAQGQETPNPNADAFKMISRFWIETVQFQIVVPPFPTNSQKPVKVQPKVTQLGMPVPTFLVHPGSQHLTQPKTMTVPVNIIQYSQTVNLNFVGITWPHVSVATLVPSDPIAVVV